MKAITIWQPWATLLPLGIKQFETRSWATSYRGPIAIHAAAIKVPQVMKKLFPLGEWNYHPDYAEKMAFLDAIAKGLKGVYTDREIMDLLNGFPTGSVVATARLIGCHKISFPHGFPLPKDSTPYSYKQGERYFTPGTVEFALGDWTPGRYAWEFADMKPIPPVPAKGKQGLWEWDGGGRNV